MRKKTKSAPKNQELEKLNIDDSIIKLAVCQFMVMLYRNGIEQIHLGGLLRLLGVDNKEASKHDDEIIIMDDDFAQYIESMNHNAETKETNSNSSKHTLH